MLLYLCGFITCALLVLIIGYIFYRGIPNVTWQLLTTQTSYLNDTIGILPNILNTLYLVLLSMVIVLPLGVGAAIYLTEYATNRRLVAVIEFATETLTGIPSIIFGLVGMLFFIQLMGLKTGVLAGSLTLVVMILPTIVRTTQESLKTVPQSYREGALALGSRQVAHGAHRGAAQLRGRHRHRLHPGCGPHRGRERGAAVHRRLRRGAQRLRHVPAGRLRLFDGGIVYVQRAGRDRRGLRHRHHFDAADPADQPGCHPGGAETEEINGRDSNMSTIIEVKDLNLWYGAHHALHSVNVDIPAHEITALIGPSGCGKSTFLKTLNRMNDLVPGIRIEGLVSYGGQDIYDPSVDTTWLRKQIGMVFQKANPFPMSIYDNVAYGPRTHGIRSRAKLDEIVENSLRAAAIWDEVKDRLKKSALGLSGGQQQRLCIARALAVEPEILLMDESTSALDPISTSKIEDLAVELKSKYTVIMVTHNMQQAARVSDNTAFFLLGDLVEFGKTEQIFSTPADKRTEDYITGRFG